jgi:hypothetical protein
MEYCNENFTLETNMTSRASNPLSPRDETNHDLNLQFTTEPLRYASNSEYWILS